MTPGREAGGLEGSRNGALVHLRAADGGRSRGERPRGRRAHGELRSEVRPGRRARRIGRRARGADERGQVGRRQVVLPDRVVLVHDEGQLARVERGGERDEPCLLYTSPSPRDGLLSRMPSSA